MESNLISDVKQWLRQNISPSRDMNLWRWGALLKKRSPSTLELQTGYLLLKITLFMYFFALICTVTFSLFCDKREKLHRDTNNECICQRFIILRGRDLNLQMPHQDKFAIYRKFFLQKHQTNQIFLWLLIIFVFLFVEYQIRKFPRTLAKMKS